MLCNIAFVTLSVLNLKRLKEAQLRKTVMHTLNAHPECLGSFLYHPKWSNI